jgi:hypothetical protein
MFVEMPVETCCVCAKYVEVSIVRIVESVKTVLELLEPTEKIEDGAVRVGF